MPDGQRFVSKRLQECNWLQAMEGGIDSSHVSFLHRGNINSDPLFKGAKGNRYNLSDARPVFEVVESAGGLFIGARRNAENGDYYWRVTQWVMPSFTMIAPRGGHTVHGHFWIPIDDENCWAWSYDYHPTRAITAAERAAMEAGKGVHCQYVPGTYRPLANKDNDYLMDRAAQKRGDSFSGIDGIAIQDGSLQESMGPIIDRTKENLVSTDNGIIMARYRLMRAAKELAEKGTMPPGRRRRASAGALGRRDPAAGSPIQGCRQGGAHGSRRGRAGDGLTAAGQPRRPTARESKPRPTAARKGREPRHDRHPWIRAGDRSGRGSAFIRSTISCSRCPTWRRRSGSIRISASTLTPPATRSRSRPPAMTSAGAWWWRASARSCTISRSAATRTTCPICRSARKRTASSCSIRPRVSRATASGFAIRPACSSRSRSRPRSSPAHKTPGTWSSSPEGVAGAPVRAKAPIVRPRRLSHVLVFTPDVDRSLAFYSNIVGLRLSDRSDRVAFMHAIHGSDHHILAFAQSPGPGLHHCSWDMSGIDDIGLGAMHMAGKGHTQGWGLGRHVLGSNYFHYVPRSLGQLRGVLLRHRLHPGHAALAGRQPPPEDSFYLWGPEPPADFTLNREL